MTKNPDDEQILDDEFHAARALGTSTSQLQYLSGGRVTAWLDECRRVTA